VKITLDATVFYVASGNCIVGTSALTFILKRKPTNTRTLNGRLMTSKETKRKSEIIKIWKKC